MKSRTVGSPIAFLGIPAAVLWTTMAMTSGAGGFAPAEVLAAEEIGVPIVSNLVRPLDRVSPFFDRPAVNAMLMKARLASAAARVGPFREKPVLDAELLRARLASASAVRDHIPTGYYPIEYAQTSYYAGANSWYIDTYYLWDVITYNFGYWPGLVKVEWSWAIQDEYENSVIWCYGENDDCIAQDWFYPDTYECVGNERFATGVWAHYVENSVPSSQLLAYYEDYNTGGCDPN